MSAPPVSFEQALALYDAGDFAGAYALAVELLEKNPRDGTLLRLAGRAGVELGRDDAVAQLQEAVAADPQNADALRDLADALLAEGRLDEAAGAIEHAVELRPGDAAALVDLAHAVHGAGRLQEAIGHLEQALEHEVGNVAALRGLVGMYREAGRLEDAREAGRKVVTFRPEDVQTALEVAEITLELGRLDDAYEAFRWLRDVDDEPEHEVYAVHGMIDTELRRERWRPALDLAVDATRVDRYGRTTDILAYIVAQVFGAASRPAPSRRDVEDALAASRDEHRRLHSSLGV
ncbi:MAG: tetratricopeptide repeat protein [Gaiellaceae bacterium]